MTFVFFVDDIKVERLALYLRCPAEGRCCTIILKTFFAEAEICEDNVALRVQQDVLRLQVPVNKETSKLKLLPGAISSFQHRSC